jgi:DedD protein
MALFKKRKRADEPVAAASPTESIEAMRRRARHRLIGAVVLVLAGVIGFPILFDTQPRPVAVDIPIEIPDRNKVKPLPLPPQAAAPAVSGKVTPEPTPPAAPSAVVPPKPAADSKPAPETRPLAEPKVAATESVPQKTAELKPAARPEPKVEAQGDDGAKARALLEGKALDATAGRFVVQVGAFSERDKAQQAQQKLERAGLKNYTQVAETEEGKRIRVRAGPFASRAEADKAAEKIKGLDLPVRILTL